MQKVEDLFAEMDQDDSGTISREEFEILKKIVQKQDLLLKKILKNKKTKKAKKS